MLKPFTYQRPQTLKDVCRAAAKPGARILAGGTDLLGCLRDGIVEASTLVSLGNLPELAGVLPSMNGQLRIGAGVTLSEISRLDLIRVKFTALAEAARSAGSPQLRNQGTLGGNLCQRPRCWYFRGDFPCARKGGDLCFAVEGENRYHCIFGGERCFIVHPSDTAPALIALQARVRLTGPGGTRLLPLEEFFVLPSENLQQETVLMPGEIVTEILLPVPAPGVRSTYRKIRERGAWDFALASAAVVLQRDGGTITQARVVLGGVAPKPWRVPAVEQALAGRPLTGETIRQAAKASTGGAVPLSQNRYKLLLLQGLIEEALESMANP